MKTTPPQLINPSLSRTWLPVRVAATVDTSIVNCPNAINSVLLGPDKDRVLLAGQATASQNGLYELTESGSPTTLTVTANQVTTITVPASRMVQLVITGTVTVTGANGALTSDAPGYLSAAATTLTVTGGETGGTVDYNAAVGLTRVADADANAEFANGKLVDVRQGSNAGMWEINSPVGALVISNALAIGFTRIRQAAQAAYDPTATRTSTPPSIRATGFIVAIATSLGALGSSIGLVKGLI